MLESLWWGDSNRYPQRMYLGFFLNTINNLSQFELRNCLIPFVVIRRFIICQYKESWVHHFIVLNKFQNSRTRSHMLLGTRFQHSLVPGSEVMLVTIGWHVTLIPQCCKSSRISGWAVVLLCTGMSLSCNCAASVSEKWLIKVMLRYRTKLLFCNIMHEYQDSVQYKSAPWVSSVLSIWSYVNEYVKS